MFKFFKYYLCFFLTPLIYAQQGGGNKYWSSVKLSYDFNKKLELNSTFSYRNTNLYETNGILYQADLSYQLPCHLNITAAYRYSQTENYEHQLRTQNRFSAGFIFNIKIKGYRLSLESKYQYGIKNQVKRNNPYPIEQYWRNEISVKKKVMKKTFIKAGAEFFMFNDRTLLNQYRGSIGLEKYFTKKYRIGFEYIYQCIYENQASLHYNIFCMSHVLYLNEFSTKKKAKNDD